MAEQSGFFDAHLVNGEYDRVYLANSFARYFANFIGNGVFGGKSNELMVEQKTTADMSIKVLSGQGWINGYWYHNNDELSLAIDIADGVLNRIDIVVLRWDNVNRVIRLAIKKGAPASNPAAPSLQRDADYYELKLAQIYVKAGATKITQADITDTRLDTSACGLVQGVIQQFDTTEFGKQIDSFIENFEAENIAKMNAVLAKLNAMADESDMASLALDVLELESKAPENALAVQTLGYAKKNMIPYPYPFGTRASNGINFIDNGDGTVTIDGTASIDVYFTLYRGKAFAPGDYTISLTNGVYGKYSACMRFVDKETTEAIAGTTHFDYESTPFVITKENAEKYDLFVGILITQGTTVSNVLIKPMVRRAEIDDATWEPYKLSVAEMIQEDESDMGCFYRINRRTGKKEWLNPDNAPGWEYPLVERWNRQPVYQMMLYAASLPNNGILVLQTNAEWDRVVSISGYAIDRDDLTSYPFPVTLHNQVNPIAVISRVESDGSLVITTNGDASYLEAYITIKYTKSY